MTTTTEHSLAWIKRVDDALSTLTEHPEVRTPTHFPLDELQNHLKTLFSKNDLTLQVEAKGWAHASDLFQGIPSPRSSLAILFSPLNSSLYFVMSEQDLKFLMSELLGGEKTAAPFIDSSLMEGFFHYLGLETLAIVEQTRFSEDLAPRLQGFPKNLEHALGKSEAFLIDVKLQFGKSIFVGKVILTKEFRAEWNGYFASLPPKPLTNEQREKIPVEVALEVGSVRLELEEWKSVKGGEFILLESGSFDQAGKGRVILTLDGHPIFRGKLQEGGIKILEYPLYEEVGGQMGDKFEGDEDVDLYGDSEEESETGSQKSVERSDAGEKISPEKIPILLTVEAGRVRMTAQELVNLTPGTVLDLKIHPEQGVDLVVNGKRVGRGELVKMNDALGVRILQM